MLPVCGDSSSRTDPIGPSPAPWIGDVDVLRRKDGQSLGGLSHFTATVGDFNGDGQVTASVDGASLLAALAGDGSQILTPIAHWLADDLRTAGIPLPAEPGNYQFKFDLVAEGICWFASHGTVPQVVEVRADG